MSTQTHYTRQQRERVSCWLITHHRDPCQAVEVQGDAGRRHHPQAAARSALVQPGTDWELQRTNHRYSNIAPDIERMHSVSGKINHWIQSFRRAVKHEYHDRTYPLASCDVATSGGRCTLKTANEANCSHCNIKRVHHETAVGESFTIYDRADGYSKGRRFGDILFTKNEINVGFLSQGLSVAHAHFSTSGAGHKSRRSECPAEMSCE